MELLPKLLMEARPFGARHVALTGGEPFLHPQFTEMVETIVNAGYAWRFVSNGWQTKPYLPLLAKYGESVPYIALSVDGENSETHDTNRGRVGSFKRVMKATNIYRKLGFSIRWSVCMNKQNKRQLEKILHLAEKLDVSMMNVAGINPTPWNTDLVLTDEESLALCKQAMELSENTKIKISIRSSLQTGRGINFCKHLQLDNLSVNTNGEVIFCCDTQKNGAVIGSLREDSLDILLKKWLAVSKSLQEERIEYIQKGNMGIGFDSCAFCNLFLKKSYPDYAD